MRSLMRKKIFQNLGAKKTKPKPLSKAQATSIPNIRTEPMPNMTRQPIQNRSSQLMLNTNSQLVLNTSSQLIPNMTNNGGSLHQSRASRSNVGQYPYKTASTLPFQPYFHPPSSLSTNTNTSPGIALAQPVYSPPPN